jgi:hypothetical protein
VLITSVSEKGNLMTQRITRRTVLKGLGTALALPWLDAMLPLSAYGSPKLAAGPKRMAFFYVPNGVNMAEWTPKAEGPLTQLPAVLEPLKNVQGQVQVLSGLVCDKAWPHGDGPGDHARAMSAFLTGAQPRKTHGAHIKAGISIDQFAAEKIGKETKFASLELGLERGLNEGNCDSGYSCAYSANISWRSETLPMAKEVNPRALFERLFGNQVKEEQDASRAKRDLYRASILDLVADDAKKLHGQLVATDKRKLDEYMTAVRELEIRIKKSGPVVAVGESKMAMPAGVPQDYEMHARLLCDVLALAWQADLTRIATFVLANEGSNRPYRSIGVPDGHHDLSHHGGNKEKLEKIKKINRFHMTQFAYFLEKLHVIKEGEKSILDSSMILYGSGNGDGNRHNHDDLPILLVGKGGGTLAGGRHVRYPKDQKTPLTNLYLALLEHLGVKEERFGDSTGKLTNLA